MFDVIIVSWNWNTLHSTSKHSWETEAITLLSINHYCVNKSCKVTSNFNYFVHAFNWVQKWSFFWQRQQKDWVIKENTFLSFVPFTVTLHLRTIAFTSKKFSDCMFVNYKLNTEQTWWTVNQKFKLRTQVHENFALRCLKNKYSKKNEQMDVKELWLFMTETINTWQLSIKSGIAAIRQLATSDHIKKK